MTNTNKSNRPFVFVRCLTYNHEKYIEDALKGFVMQKTDFPFLAVVIDDCSTDGTADIVRRYEAQYPDIIKGIYHPFNYRTSPVKMNARADYQEYIDKATYWAECEGDDYWTDPYKLQKQVDFLETNPDYIACFHNARVFNGKEYWLFNSINESHTHTAEDLIKRRWFIATASLLYKNIKIEYPKWSKNVVSSDYLLELLLAHEGKFYYMDDIMSVYRQEGQGISSTILNANKLKMYDGLIFLLTNMKELYAGEYADAFDKSIDNYQHLKEDYQKELFYESHPFLRAFRPKTYKRAIKKWLRRYI